MLWFCEVDPEDRVAIGAGLGLCTGCRQTATVADCAVVFNCRDEFVVTIKPDSTDPDSTTGIQDMRDEKFGFNLELAGFNGLYLIVVRIHEGPCTDWNRVHTHKQIRCNDRIVAVNGLHGRPEELIRGLRQASAQVAAGETAVSLLIRRPEQRSLQLKRTRDDDSLGLHMDVRNDAMLVVLGIEPGGFVDTFNMNHLGHTLSPRRYSCEREWCCRRSAIADVSYQDIFGLVFGHRAPF